MSTGSVCKKCGNVEVDPDDAKIVKEALVFVVSGEFGSPTFIERAKRILQRCWGWQP